MTTKEQAKIIWDKFEKPPIDVGYMDCLQYGLIVVDNVFLELNRLKQYLPSDSDAHSVIDYQIEYWQDVSIQLNAIYLGTHLGR